MSHDCNVYARAFKYYVRPILEYCLSVWSPSLQRDINYIKSVQRLFSNSVFRTLHLPNVSYENRLKYMKLEQLNFRRNVTDIVELFKICKGFTCCNIINDRFVHNNTKRGHIFKFSVLRLLSKPCCAFLTIRHVIMFNSLPKEILGCTNVATFRLCACRFHERSQS